MLKHILNIFSDAQAVTATAVSTNVIDTGSANLGKGEPIDLVVEVPVAFTGLTSVQVALQESADNSTFNDVMLSKAIPLAELVASKNHVFRCPIPSDTKRYLRLNYVVVGTGTAGKFNSYLNFSRR